MASSIEDLPPELWDRIFHYVSRHRADLARCRLVCKPFCAIASKLLFSRVVLAEHSDSLRRICNVLEHPTLHRHVTELAYDASRYIGHIAKDYEDYSHVYEHRALRFLHEGDQAEIDKHSQLSPRIWAKENVNRCHGPEEAVNVYSGFIEYGKRWLDQDIVTRGHLHLAALKNLLNRASNLRSIIFTDFRHFAGPGEPFSDLRGRLFGNVLGPVVLALFLGDETAQLFDVLKAIQETPKARILSFSIGGHAYEDFDTNGIRLIDDQETNQDYPNAPAALRDFYLNQGEWSNDTAIANPEVLKSLKTLKHLRLPIDIPLEQAFEHEFDWNYDLSHSGLFFMLQCCSSTLVFLQLWAFEGRLRNEDPKTVMKFTSGFLTALLDNLAFKSLRHLELGNWRLPEGIVFKNFFSRHSATLTEVRLLKCSVYEDPRPLGEWVGENMLLAGVQLDLTEIFLQLDSNESAESDSTSNDEETTSPDHDHSSHGVEGSRERKRVDDGEVEQTVELQSPQWQDRDLEVMWLNGRRNNRFLPLNKILSRA